MAVEVLRGYDFISAANASREGITAASAYHTVSKVIGRFGVGEAIRDTITNTASATTLFTYNT